MSNFSIEIEANHRNRKLYIDEFKLDIINGISSIDDLRCHDSLSGYYSLTGYKYIYCNLNTTNPVTYQFIFIPHNEYYDKFESTSFKNVNQAVQCALDKFDEWKMKCNSLNNVKNYI